MNKQEIGQLLTLAALVDNRTVTAEACLMWHEIIGHLDYQQAVMAMQEHYRETTDWLMPAHVIRRVRANRRVALPPPMSEARECAPDAHRRLPDGTCFYCTSRV